MTSRIMKLIKSSKITLEVEKDIPNFSDEFCYEGFISRKCKPFAANDSRVVSFTNYDEQILSIHSGKMNSVCLIDPTIRKFIES